ncbi:putative oxidoreductase [Sinobacterium norvegicum]|uniref:Oxidoreductase n=1 Tax=Sinobacterium norvegicum TaxID=1641715 RepID=A0ABN8EQ33_9GAMM|nr:SDR family NAD(P)-dependent oxidoreductase [Sinobacterium norvegicum]CAH0993098.1 putative oxidoreductase [Sinobacterium norvegicum]
MDIQGKTAVVTGGASGLGEATVRLYAAKGANVAIFDMNDQRGAQLAAELGATVIYQNVNVTDEQSVASAIDATVTAFGEIHICNNFAGIGDAKKTLGRDGAFPLDIFNKVINVNLIGTFNVLRLVAQQMSTQQPVTDCGSRGVIINTASIAAYEGQMGQAAYSASKGGIVGMTLPIARDLAQYGIRVNTIVPGLVHTPLFESLPEDAFESLSKSPLFPQRLARPDEIAHLSQFIVESDYTNAECIRMDAGIRMQPR